MNNAKPAVPFVAPLALVALVLLTGKAVTDPGKTGNRRARFLDFAFVLDYA